MGTEKIIERYYQEAVIGLTEDVLNDRNRWYNHVLALPKPNQIIYTVSIFNWQVLNGGFHQYFFNSYGQFVFLAIDNLKQIKAFGRADLLTKALTAVNSDCVNPDTFRELIFTRTHQKIVNFDEALSDFLEKLNYEYDGIQDENYTTLFNSYLRQFGA